MAENKNLRSIETEKSHSFSAPILPTAVGRYRKSSPDKKIGYAKWYDESGNLETESILEVLMGNNIAPAILNTKSKFIVGNGLRTYEEVIVEGKKKLQLIEIAEVSEWLRDNDIDEMLFCGAKDLQFFGNGFFELIFNKGKTLASVRHHDATTVRSSVLDEKGKIPYYFLCGNWAKPKYIPEKESDGNVFRVKAYQKNIEVLELYPKCIFHAREYSAGLPYYSLPEWYGSMKWIELANTIPQWHLSGIKNGYNVRYLVEISDSFFSKFQNQSDAEAAKQQLQQDLDQCLSGAENVGKAIYAVMSSNEFAEKGVIRITPISAELHDGAFSILFEHSNTAATSGFAIDPTLCGIETEGKLSSAAEKRIAYELWLRLHAVRPRKVLLSVVNAISKIQGWAKKYPNLRFGFENVELTTLDVNPTGNQNIIAG